MINRIFPKEEMDSQKKYTELVKERLAEAQRATGHEYKIYVMTLGCQQNESDSEKIIGMAQEMGYKQTDSPENADLIMINTCAIREHAEKRALSFIGGFKKLKAENPALLIGVCGCMVSQQHRSDELKHRYPYVDFVFSTSLIHKFPQHIYERIIYGRRIFSKTKETDYLVAEGLPIKRESKTHAWVSIMYGCNNYCSYCIVPYVRGRERSRKKDEIIKEVTGLVSDGYKDITLLGQNVNSYGKDGAYGYDFADLLAELANINGDFTLRFMTSHPKDATEKLIDTIARYPKIAKHFHLPMQSGSDRILKLMNRHYDMPKYLAIIEYLRKKNPDITITSDIIVGFPGETNDDFEQTLEMLEKIRFDMLYSFIYSPRKGTPAADMPGQISQEEKNRRYNRLLEVQGEVSLSRNLSHIGETLRVLCDGVSKTDSSRYSGRSDGNKIVFFKSQLPNRSTSPAGQFVNVKIERAEAFALYGEEA